VQMKTRIAGVLAASASAVALMAVPALASTSPQTSANGSVLSGNQIIAPITIPVNACGNAIAILGIANASCVGGASVFPGPAPWLGW
jgi:hypothetical protein